jgi:hypothetical protein
MNSNIQIISDFRLAMEMSHDLELMVTFKGVPVICKARVTQIVEENVIFYSPDPGVVQIEREKKVSILGSDYFEPSTGKVIRVEIQNGTVELSHFSYLGTRLGERMVMRVEPKEPIQVALSSEDLLFNGNIADLSVNGIGIQIDQASYDPALKPGATIKATFDLPSGRVVMEGIVLSTVKLSQTYRLAMRFNQNGPDRISIFRYLIDRRAEIEHELDSEFQKARSITS